MGVGAGTALPEAATPAGSAAGSPGRSSRKIPPAPRAQTRSSAPSPPARSSGSLPPRRRARRRAGEREWWGWHGRDNRRRPARRRRRPGGRPAGDRGEQQVPRLPGTGARQRRCPGGVAREAQGGGADLDPVAGPERLAAVDPPPVDQDAVHRAEVGDHRPFAAQLHPRVPAGDLGVVEDDVVALLAPDGQGGAAERVLAPGAGAVFDGQAGRGGRRRRRGRRVERRARSLGRGVSGAGGGAGGAVGGGTPSTRKVVSPSWRRSPGWSGRLSPRSTPLSRVPFAEPRSVATSVPSRRSSRRCRRERRGSSRTIVLPSCRPTVAPGPSMAKVCPAFGPLSTRKRKRCRHRWCDPSLS